LGYLPIYILSIYKNTTNKINATATIILIIAGVGLIVTESGTGLSKATSDSFWRGVIESNEMMNYNKTVNHRTYELMLLKEGTDSIKRNQIIELENASKSMMEYTSKMKAYLISITEGITLAEAEKINLDDLRSSGWNDVLNDRLLSDDYADLDYTAKKLKAKIEAYKQLLMKTSPEVDLSNLKTDQVMVYGELIPWEKSNFEQLPCH
jgi:hypothetical protein